MVGAGEMSGGAGRFCVRCGLGKGCAGFLGAVRGNCDWCGGILVGAEIFWCVRRRKSRRGVWGR